VYYQFPEKVIASIKKPLRQLISFEKNDVTIYYPDNSIAFRFVSSNPVSFSFFETFINVIKEDFGLCDRGYTLKNHQTKKDTLITYWNPPPVLLNTASELQLVYVKNKIIYSELKDKNGKTFLEAEYKNHINYGDYYFPREINTKLTAEQYSILEKITYNNIIFNDTLPEEIKNFEIPEGVEIEEIRW
jgi:outer membrane lipoprotein-sorting protein